MHVCHVIARLKGGTGTAISYFIRQQLAAGHRVSLVYGADWNDLDPPRRFAPDPAELVPWSVGREIAPRRDFSSLRRLNQILGDLRPDIVHLHSTKAGALGRIACALRRIPHVYMPHSISYLRRDISRKTAAFYRSIEWLLALSGGPVVACSPGEFEAIRSLPGRAEMIPNQIDAVGIAPRYQPTNPDTPFRVVLCGRLEPQKNPELVAELVRRAPPDWEWVWVGDGVGECLFSDLPAMRITGWVPRPDALDEVARGHVLLQASSWEGMPYSILEAMAMGRAVVASDIEGNRDLVRDGETGFLCKSADQFLERLHHLAADRSLVNDQGRKGREIIFTEHALDVIGPRWVTLYEQVRTKFGR